ncbi:Beta-lactamase-related [Macleaya cordata]|uniref:Beta-lactamase-related n=1 Tax=Macleaya cordata TaxID=56857 RepID=A0A200PT93_MACCD|nr:Beta-lactamase-related [Macleaya cordata]
MVFSGVESRLATLTIDMEELKSLPKMGNRPELPSTFQLDNISEIVTALPMLFNTLNIRRAIIPAANGHCSARALARYYATLADGGRVPPPHAASFKPSLGSHTHIPKFPSLQKPKKKVCKIKEFGLGFRRFSLKDGSVTSFGHSGIGGSTGFCDIKHNFAIAVTLNKMALGAVTANIIELVCSELNVPLPEEFSKFGERGPDMQLNLVKQVIN